MATPQTFSIPTLLLFAALLCLGMAHIAMLPPFEGFDETGHYSSIREIARTGHAPVYGQSAMSLVVPFYTRTGPTPYSSAPPFNANGGLTYENFFKSKCIVSYQKLWRTTPLEDVKLPKLSTAQNWEAQHPPLYYWLLAQADKFLGALPLVSEFFVLRLLSFLMAFAGLIIAFAATKNFFDTTHGADEKRDQLMVLYPFIIPMFVPEFARLGNDALCLLLFGIAWALLLRLDEKQKPLTAAALGVVLGLGLLTKAFFIPIMLGVLIFLFLKRATNFLSLALIILPALAIGGGWYGDALAHGGIGHDAITLQQKSGLLAGLKAHFAPAEFLRDGAAAIATYFWAGTWSLTRFPPAWHLGLFIAFAICMAGYMRRLQQEPAQKTFWLPLILLALFALGMLHHMVIDMAAGGGIGTPGWYLHILAPAFMLCIGCAAPFMQKYSAKFFGAGVLYGLLYLAAALWSQAALFAGCAVKGDDKFYHFTGKLFCLDHAASIFGNLRIIAWPEIAVISGIGALIFLTASRICTHK